MLGVFLDPIWLNARECCPRAVPKVQHTTKPLLGPGPCRAQKEPNRMKFEQLCAWAVSGSLDPAFPILGPGVVFSESGQVWDRSGSGLVPIWVPILSTQMLVMMIDIYTQYILACQISLLHACSMPAPRLLRACSAPAPRLVPLSLSGPVLFWLSMPQ